MPEDESYALIAILTELVLEVYAGQMAVVSLLRKTPAIDAAALDLEIQQARQAIGRLPLVQDLRARRDPSQLEALVSALRTIRQ